MGPTPDEILLRQKEEAAQVGMILESQVSEIDEPLPEKVPKIGGFGGVGVHGDGPQKRSIPKLDLTKAKKIQEINVKKATGEIPANGPGKEPISIVPKELSAKCLEYQENIKKSERNTTLLMLV
jgi:hypothetical protein